MWIGGIDLFLIVATTLRPYLHGSLLQALVAPFNLAIEMNLAAWFSGISLLALGLLAYERFAAGEARSKAPWLILAVLLILLSIDEIGSLHERAGGMAALLPYIVVFVLLLAGAMAGLLITRQPFYIVLCLAAMFALFGSVILQEDLEQIVAWPDWFRGIRVGLEEGSELLGMFLGFWGFARFRSAASAGRIPARSLSAVVPDPRQFKRLVIILVAGLALHAAASRTLASNLQVLEIGKLGNPAVWYPAALFVLLACLAFWKSRAGMGRLWLLLSGFALLCSLGVIYFVSPRAEVSRFSHLGLLSNFYFLSAVQIALFALFRLRLAPFDGRTLFKGASVFGLVALLLLAAWLSGGMAARWIVAGVVPCILILDFLSLRVTAPIPRSVEVYEPVSR